jgi:uncharacterized repeat protein (TIGR01451 family)
MLSCGTAGAQFATNGTLTVVSPPSAHGAVGSNYVMTAANPDFRVHDRTGGLVRAMTHLQFWTNDATIAFGPSGYPYAPRVLYDGDAGRWIVAAAADALTTNAAYLLAVSDGQAPTGTWARYRIPVDDGEILTADALNMGLNRNWIALHANIIAGTNFTPGKSFTTSNSTLVRTDLLLFDKQALYTNSTLNTTRFMLSSNDWHLAPAVTHDPDEDTLYLAHIPRLGSAMPLLSTVTGPVGSETLTLGVATAQVFNVWQYYQPAFQEFGPQRGSSNRIDLMDGRIRTLVVRDGTLWFCHSIFLPLGGATHSAVQWWQVEPDGAVLQRGRVEDPGGEICYAYPSLAVNARGDALIGFSAFSTSFYASAGYAYRDAADPPGTTRGPRLYKDGEAPYVSQTTFRNVWGEYSATVADPVETNRLWTLQSYANDPADRWGTWWAAVDPPAEADLVFSKHAGAAQVALGSNVTFTLTVTNLGPAEAEVILIDPLPSQLAFVSASGSTGVCTEAGGEVTCHVGVLAPNAGAVVAITAVAVTPGRAHNTATAWTAVATDTDRANNTQTATVCIPFDVLPDVWINELHYDDVGGTLNVDTDEGVEIAGPAGTSLDGLELLFYEGLTGRVYANRLLTGSIDHETNGYGAVWFEMPYLNDGGIHKGDGVALVPPCTGVIQFISYEGKFTAEDGQAAGLESVDIGVVESNTTPVGYALQLAGNGLGYGDFAWQDPAPHSRGELNPGQTIPEDADGDGIPSWWEYMYFGGPTNADPQADGDDDGLNELGEYIADTNPTNPASRFFIAAVSLSNTWPVVSFDTSARRVYGLETATNLLTNSWSAVGTNLAGVGGPLAIPDTNFPGPVRFYRARVAVP